MNKAIPPSPVVKKPTTYKQVDMGQPVVLDQNYLMLHHRDTQLEAITQQTMQNAEYRASEIVSEAQAQAQAILQAAQAEAERLIQEEGIAQRDVIREAAYQEGYQAGYQEGQSVRDQEFAEALASGHQLVRHLVTTADWLQHHQQDRLVQVLHAILKLVLNHEIQTRPEHLHELISKALDKLQLTTQAKILLHPETLKQFQATFPTAGNILTQLERVQLIPDNRCQPLDIYLESVEGLYHLTPDEQAQVYLAQVLPDVLHAPAPEDPLSEPTAQAIESAPPEADDTATA